ncbi:MAG: hypothetical protein ISS49_15985 [Anaerolineae bacterium]|nr:hypothetical protein [Anaerolineae bacterium]
MSKVLELYGVSTRSTTAVDWKVVLAQETCPYLHRKCLKTRKSEPEVTIGTCTVLYSRGRKKVTICPQRLLERNQIFIDCIHLLTLHEPGNELHIVREVSIPGGSVDYFLISARDKKVRDFVGIELQALDTTGTVWPERQRFLQEHAIEIDEARADFSRGFAMNWKMTAKTILVQLHHKVETFEHISKHLVLVTQDHLLDYMRRAFQFEHLNNARIGDPMHIHSYKLDQTEDGSFWLNLESRFSTDANGIAKCLGLQVSPRIELEEIIALLESKITPDTLLTLQ